MSWIRFSPSRPSLAIAGFTLAVALVALASLLPAPASAKDGQVTVRAAGTTNASVTIKLSDLGGQLINNHTYKLASGPVSISGYSLRQVLEAADAESDKIDLDTIPSIKIDLPSAGRTVTISGDEARNPSAFKDGPPVFYEDNGATVFVMPGRGNDSGNRFRFNFAPVGVSIQTGAGYDVEISASRTKVEAGESLRLTATVTGQKSGERLTYRWIFGDGRSKKTNAGRVDHRFGSAGSFAVVLEVTGDSGSGQSGILIEVGKAKVDKPDKKPDKPDRKPSGNDGNGGSGNPDGGGGYGPGYGSGDYGSGTGAYTPAPASPVTPPASPAPRPKPTESTPPGDGLTPVTGELVSPETAAVAQPTTANPVESANPAAPGTERGGFGVPGAVWTVAGVGLLLGLGGFAELRVFSRLY